MKMMKRLILPSLLSAAIISPAIANTDNAELAIQANLLSWMYAYNTGNAEALAELYTEDAIVMPPSDETIISKDAIKSYWNAELSGELSAITIDPVRIKIEGDTAYQAAIWTAKIKETGESVGGNVLTVLERQPDGTWKTKLHSWN